MTTVLMNKNGESIRVDSSTLAQHKALGWTVDTPSSELATVCITVAAEDTDVINVSIQLQDAAGANLSEGRALLAYLADAADGLVPTATAPDGSIATGTNGGCVHLITDKVFILNTNSDGAADVDIEEAAADTWYLVVILPNGERVVSDPITFTA